MPPIKCEHGNIKGDLKDCLPCYLEASLLREQGEIDRLLLKLESTKAEWYLAFKENATLKARVEEVEEQVKVEVRYREIIVEGSNKLRTALEGVWGDIYLFRLHEGPYGNVNGLLAHLTMDCRAALDTTALAHSNSSDAGDTVVKEVGK